MFTKAINSANAPKAIGPYSPAVKLGDFVYLSGMLPVDPKTNELVKDDIVEQTHQVLTNIKALLAEMHLELRHVVKTTVYMADLSEFQAMNEVYGQYFAEPYPARSCVEVKALPKGARVEIECFVIDTLVYEEQLKHQCAGGCHECSGGCCEGHEDEEDSCCCGECSND